MARQVHATAMREPNWAVIEWDTFDVVQDGFSSEQAAEDWLRDVSSDQKPFRPDAVKNADDLRVVDIGK
jgi:hypothetical protein